MTMPFRPLNSKNYSKFLLPGSRAPWYGALGIAVIFFLIVAAARWAPHALATPAQAILQPVVAIRDLVGSGFGEIATFFKNKENLEKENADLQSRVVLFKATLAERDYYQNQAEQLQKLYGDVASGTPAKFIAAKIISKPNFSPYDTLIVTRPSQEIMPGDLVFVDNHTLIGFVSSVSAVAATITTYSTPGQTTNVLIGPNALEAMAIGLGGGSLGVRLPRSSPVKQGDVVIAADISGNNILGRVEVATGTPTDPFLRVLFASPVDIFDLSYVLIKK